MFHKELTHNYGFWKTSLQLQEHFDDEILIPLIHFIEHPERLSRALNGQSGNLWRLQENSAFLGMGNIQISYSKKASEFVEYNGQNQSQFVLE